MSPSSGQRQSLSWSALAPVATLMQFDSVYGFVGVPIALPVSAVPRVDGSRLRAACVESRLCNG